jgi:hypothetical protein
MSARPTYDELLAQVAALQAQLTPPGGLKGPHALASDQVTTVSETPQQTTIKTTRTAPTGMLAVPTSLLKKASSTATPEEIIAQIGSLKSLIISGVNSAGYGDKRTEFRSLSDLRQILAALEEELDELSGSGNGRIRQIRMTNQWDKGL